MAAEMINWRSGSSLCLLSPSHLVSYPSVDTFTWNLAARLPFVIGGTSALYVYAPNGRVLAEQYGGMWVYALVDSLGNEGHACVYHGSADGLSASAGWTVESDQDSAMLGRSAGTAGDVNGDGYVVVGGALSLP